MTTNNISPAGGQLACGQPCLRPLLSYTHDSIPSQRSALESSSCPRSAERTSRRDACRSSGQRPCPRPSPSVSMRGQSIQILKGTSSVIRQHAGPVNVIRRAKAFQFVAGAAKCGPFKTSSPRTLIHLGSRQRFPSYQRGTGMKSITIPYHNTPTIRHEWVRRPISPTSSSPKMSLVVGIKSLYRGTNSCIKAPTI